MKTKNVKNSKEITENNATTDTTVQASMDGQRAEAGAPAETEEIQNTETVQAPTDHTPEALPTVLMDIAQLRTSPYNPRTTYEEEGIKELAATLRESGLLHPLHVRPKDGHYEIITGKRRFHAAKLLGWKQIAVYVRETTDAQARDMALTENLQREDLNPIEEAEGYKTLIETYHMTQEDAAATVGKSRPAVANAMRLLTLDESVREAVKDGRLSAGHARALLPLPAVRQREAAEAIAAQGLSVRQTEALVKRLTTEKKEREPSIEEITHKLHAHIAEEELAQSLGRGVKIVAGRKKGRIELDYYDMDDLNDLLDALGTLQQRKNGGTKK